MQHIANYPTRYPDRLQTYKANAPYPMNFTQAPSFSHQVLVEYGGQPVLQGLSMVKGPVMFPVRPAGSQTRWERGAAYPITHSIPDPYQQAFIDTMGQMSQATPLGYYTRGNY